MTCIELQCMRKGSDDEQEQLHPENNDDNEISTGTILTHNFKTKKGFTFIDFKLYLLELISVLVSMADSHCNRFQKKLEKRASWIFSFAIILFVIAATFSGVFGLYYQRFNRINGKYGS